MKLNRTTLRTVEILKLVSKKPDGITLDEICAKLDMPKTSAYDIVTTLVQTGMIHVAREQKQRYTIGLTAYRIGINYTNNLDFISTIDPVLKAFSREVGKTVFFGIRSDDSIVYICKFEPENPIITTATVGTKNPIYCTSLGKAIMAYTEDEDRDGVLSRISFKKHTDRTICARALFQIIPLQRRCLNISSARQWARKHCASPESAYVSPAEPLRLRKRQWRTPPTRQAPGKWPLSRSRLLRPSALVLISERPAVI